MSSKTVAISINAAWNIVNFRKGLISGLQRAGYRVVAIAPADGYEAQLASLGVDFIPLEMDRQGTSVARDLLLLARYYALLRKLRPIAYLGYTAKPNIYGSLAAHALGIPVINNIAGLGTAFIRRGLLTRIVGGLYRAGLRRSRTVFFQNEEDQEAFLKAGIVRATQAGLLPGSGIDLSHFRPAPVGQEPRFGPTFLLIARLLWDKGVREYVEAARIVRDRLPHARIQILGFVGAENPTAVPRSEVERWSEEGIIEYLGQADDVRPLIEKADCIVLPSYREGLPRSLLEGAAMGKPLIASDVPGCRQIVRDGVNGFLCRVRDPHSLAESMLKFAALPAEAAQELGRRSRELAEREFDERLVVDRYLQVLRAVEASPRTGAGRRLPSDRTAP